MSSSPPAKRKRNRIILVCSQCRAKKTRCDKKWPCNQCIRAKCPEACVYDTSIPNSAASKINRSAHRLVNYQDEERQRVASLLGGNVDNYGSLPSINVPGQQLQPGQLQPGQLQPGQHPGPQPGPQPGQGQLQPGQQPGQMHQLPGHPAQMQPGSGPLVPPFGQLRQPPFGHNVPPGQPGLGQLGPGHPSQVPVHGHPGHGHPGIGPGPLAQLGHDRSASVSGPATQEPGSSSATSASPDISAKSTQLTRVAASLAGINPMVPAHDVFNLHMSLAQLSSAGSGEPTDVSDPRYQQQFAPFPSSQKMIFFVELTQQEPGGRLYWARNDERGHIKVIALHNFDAVTRRAVDAATRNYFGSLHVAPEIQRPRSVEQLNRYGLSLGLTFSTAYDPQASLFANLSAMMPPRPVVHAFLRRFFAKVYPLYPVLDEPWVFASADRVFRYNADGSFSHAAISSKSDFLTVSQLLFIMRMGYLTYLTNSRSVNDAVLDSPDFWAHDRSAEHFGPLRRWAVSINAVDLAHRFYQQGSFRCKPSFLLLQVNILRLVNHMLSFETETAYSHSDGDITCGSLVSLALSLNLDQDPDHVANFPGDAAARNLRRKVWYVVLYLDQMSSFVFFTSRNIGPKRYNTKLPQDTPDSGNIADSALEQETLRLLRESYHVMNAAGPLLKMCIDLNSTYKVSDLVQRLTDLEILLNRTYGPLHLMYESSKSVCTVGRVRTHYSLLLFMAHLYFYLHLYYKHMNRPETNFFFFKKTLSILYVELDSFGAELVHGNDNHFDVAFTYFMAPLATIYFFISYVFGIAFAANLNCTLVLFDAEGTVKAHSLALVKALAFKNLDFVVAQSTFGRYLAQRYFYAWKLTKVSGFNYKFICGESFYCMDHEALKTGLINWSDQQFQEILQLIPESSDLDRFPKPPEHESRSAFDADLKGESLYKVVQTDNLWIAFNSLAETEPSVASFKPDPPTGTRTDLETENGADSSVPEPGAISNGISNPTSNGFDYIDDGAALLQFEPSVSDFVDFTLTGGEWTLAEYLARNPNP